MVKSLLLLSHFVFLYFACPAFTMSWGHRALHPKHFQGSEDDTSRYLKRHCSGQRRPFEQLVEQMLLPYKDGIAVDDLFKMSNCSCYSVATPSGTTCTALLVLDGQLYVHKSTRKEGVDTKAFAYYYIPLMQQLSSLVRLPDMLMIFNPNDAPTDDGLCGGPAFGYCNVQGSSTNLLLPASCYDPVHPNTVACSPGKKCTPGAQDDRTPMAVFLGSPTGWLKGKRRGVLLAGQKHPNMVYSDVRYIPDTERQFSGPNQLNISNKPGMTLQEQAETFKYFVSVDGQCASMRLKSELSSPSAVFVVQSDEQEWYTPLLRPYTHYIPVLFDPDVYTAEGGLDLVSKIHWAENHPDKIADIVRSANKFSSHSLTEQAQLCFATLLLNRYAALIDNPKRLRSLYSNNDTDYELL